MLHIGTVGARLTVEPYDLCSRSSVVGAFEIAERSTADFCILVTVR